MNPIRMAIEKPVGVSVAVLLVVLFGLLGLQAIPIQLVPTVDRPVVTVNTSWPGRSPQEVVDEITKEQEERLKSVSNLDAMRSLSREGASEITLEFLLGANIDRALQEVADALRQVPAYPDEVEEPVIKASEGASENAIAWIIIDVAPDKAALHPDFDVTTLFDFLDREVKPQLERLDGVAEVNIYGGREREVRVLVDPTALAQRGLGYDELIAALRAQNLNTSAGSITEGKRDYRVRVLGRFVTPDQVLETVLAYRESKPVYVRDVATVEVAHKRLRGFVRSLGGQSLAMNVIRQSGANVMQIMDALRARLREVEADVLPRAHPTVGPDLRLRQVYDETVYITSAIDLVTQNLWLGGGIAMLVLLFFLRSLTSTGVIACAIPISVIGTFLVLLALGRNLNVISLAGLAFATGMVVDNAIVVLENIYRRLQEGDTPLEAAYRGGREVWGAVLASTLTTVAVFVPVLTMSDEAGQLFRDIAIALVASVSLSLVISITVIPSACARWLKAPGGPRPIRITDEQRSGQSRVARLEQLILWLITGWRAWSLRPALIVSLTVLSIGGAWLLAPPLDYLPPGNRNLVFGGLLIPPGYSLDQQLAISRRIDGHLAPYAQARIEDPASVAALAPIPRREAPDEPFAPVPIENFFIGAFNGGMFVGATSQDPEVVLPIGTLVTNAMSGIPDAFGGAQQSSIFGRGAGGGNTIDLEVSGPRLDEVVRAAGMMFGLAARRYGYGNVRPDPSNFNLTQPEWQLRLTPLGRELGLRTTDVSVAARALFDGAFVGDFQIEGDTVDLVVLPRGGRLDYKETLQEVPLFTPSGRTIPFASAAEVSTGTAPQAIQRIEELASVSVKIVPPPGRPLEEVMAEVRGEIVGQAQAAGVITPSMRVRLEGTAAKLDQVKGALFGAAPEGEVEEASWQRWLRWPGWALLGVTLLFAGAVIRELLRKTTRGAYVYGGLGAIAIAALLGGIALAIASDPSLLGARFVWALLVTYLLMCALFESFLYPLVIMFSVPLAVVGGFAGLRVVHEVTLADPTRAVQQLDVLTMLGFVILIGVVVNNAILLVHQALNFMRGTAAEGPGHRLEPLQAVAASVRTRVRPIFMSTLTSIGAMLPLVLKPGAGSEMYRGLGSVVVGGLLCSTLFTLVLVPLLFSLVLQMAEGLRTMMGSVEAEVQVLSAE